MGNVNLVMVALYHHRNYSIRTIHSLLENIEGITPHTIFFKSYDTNLFNPHSDKEEALFIDLIKKINPAIVGFSVLTPYIPVARRLTNLVKNNTSSSVIWGGIHPTIDPESCINEVDMLCVGEGDEFLKEFAEHLRDNKPYKHIKNLWLREKGVIIRNPMRPLVQNLDTIPFPSYGNDSYYFIDQNKVTKTDPLLSGKVFFAKPTRGCTHACSFCVTGILRPTLKDLGNYFRIRSVDNIIKEIKNHLKIVKNTEFIFFSGEEFGKEEAWLNEFEVKYKNEIGLPFFAEYNPENINPKMLTKLTNAGLAEINCGIQTGSDYIRKNIFLRSETNKRIIDIAKIIEDYKIKVRYDLILDNPYETEKTLLETIELILKLPKPRNFNLFSLQFFPNYTLTKRALKDGYITPADCSIETLFKKTNNDFAYKPRFSKDKIVILQNVIWLMVWGHFPINDNFIRYAVFKNSIISKICLFYINFTSILMGNTLGIGGVLRKHAGIFNFLNRAKSYITKNSASKENKNKK